MDGTKGSVKYEVVIGTAAGNIKQDHNPIVKTNTAHVVKIPTICLDIPRSYHITELQAGRPSDSCLTQSVIYINDTSPF